MTFTSGLLSLSFLLIIVSCNKNTEQEPLKKGLIAFYPFNGNANDESGNKYHSIVNGPVLSSDRFGINGKSYSFNGLNAYIQIPPLTKAAGLNEFTISVWIRPKRYAPFILTFDGSSIEDECFSYLGLYESNGAFGNNHVIVNAISLCKGTLMQEPLANPINKWTHIVLVQYPERLSNDSTIFRYILYNNGTKVFRNASSQTSPYNPMPTAFNYGGVIGNDINRHFTYFQGDIDDVRIYDRRLSEEEVLELYNLQY